jgi:pimeloyl-ACP methyl ester carboxylesterase
MTTWAQWRARSQPLVVDGLELATYDLGSPGGHVLTFLHGYPSASVDLAPVLERLEGWRAVTLDLPGFGGSSAPRGHPQSIHAAADAVEALWAHLGVTDTLLVAHDYSVSVAQELLARRVEGTLPVTVTGVVWMNGGLYPDLHRPTLGQQILLDPEKGEGLAAAMTREVFLDGLRGTWGERIPMDDALVVPIWDSMEEGGGAARLHELLHYLADRRTHEARWRSALEGCDLPMTFVWGDLDPVSGAHMVVRVVERLPAARVVRLADVGHWPLLEAPDEVAAAIGAMA